VGPNGLPGVVSVTIMPPVDSGPPDPGGLPERSKLADSGLDDLLREVLARVDTVVDERGRLQLLLDAVVAMTGDLSLDGVLARIVQVATRLADAQYAALGVLSSSSRTRLRTFVHHGMDPETVTKIGDLPHGFGLLGLILDRPLRLHEIAEHPESYGFPPHHPPMDSFLGVPVRTRDRVFGNLYLTEKTGGGDFTEQDEKVVIALAAAAGVAIENAELYEEAARRERWLQATAEIASLLVRAQSGSHALHAVADRAREASGADVTWIVTGHDVEELVLESVSGVPFAAGDAAGLGLEDSLAARVVRTGEVVTVDDLSEESHALEPAPSLGWPALGAAVVVPLRSASGVEGALALAWTRENIETYATVDAALPASFAEQATLALEVGRARDDQQRLAVFEDRDRIARDLHDLVIQRLFAVGLSLQGAARLAGRAEGSEPVVGRLESAVDDLDVTIKDIRRTIFALGSLDTAADIQSEVGRLVDRAASTLKFRPSLTFEGPVRTLVAGELAPDVLAVLGEALSNASRHAEASAVEVLLSAGDRVTLTVADNGKGLQGTPSESGLRNMRERAERRDGTFEVTSAPGGGTLLAWSVPLKRA
jgi:signal transduction histidine kinase